MFERSSAMGARPTRHARSIRQLAGLALVLLSYATDCNFGHMGFPPLK